MLVWAALNMGFMLMTRASEYLGETHGQLRPQKGNFKAECGMDPSRQGSVRLSDCRRGRDSDPFLQM